MTNELKQNAPLNTKDPKSLEALERLWLEYKMMRFGYWKDKTEEVNQ